MAFNLSKRSNVKVGIEQSDYCATAQFLDLPVAEIRGVDEIESAGSGFLTSSQRPKILFEGHLFYRELNKLGLAQKAAKAEPTICYPKWTKSHYIGREGEYARLAKATELCHKYKISDAIALKCASWGRYQILGSNYKQAGFGSVEDYVESMFLDEDNHLEAFASYLLATNLDDVLRAGKIALFAARYNGPGYKRNNYDTKIANAIVRFRKQKIDCRKILEGEVVDVMPGDRNAFPPEEGFANTSFDDRYNEPVDTEIGKDDGEVAPKPENGSEGQETANQTASAIVNVGADPVTQRTDTDRKIEAAKNLPTTNILDRVKTGFNKIWAFIYAVITGAIIIPQWIQTGITLESIQKIGGIVWDSRYIIAALIIIWFLMNKYESITLRKTAMHINSDPERGAVNLYAPQKKQTLWSRVTSWWKK